MPGKSIAVNRGTLEDTSLTEAAPPDADIKRFDNYNSVIQAFLSGQAQLMAVGNDVGAQVLARQVTLKPEQKFQLMTSPDHIAPQQERAALEDRRSTTPSPRCSPTARSNKISEKWLGKPLDPKDLQATDRKARA